MVLGMPMKNSTWLAIQRGPGAFFCGKLDFERAKIFFKVFAQPNPIVQTQRYQPLEHVRTEYHPKG